MPHGWEHKKIKRKSRSSNDEEPEEYFVSPSGQRFSSASDVETTLGIKFEIIPATTSLENHVRHFIRHDTLRIRENSEATERNLRNLPMILVQQQEAKPPVIDH